MEKSKLMMAVIIVLLVALLGTVVTVVVLVMPMLQGIANIGQVEPGFVREAPRNLRITEIDTVLIGDRLISNLFNDDGTSSGRMVSMQIAVGIDNTQGGDSTQITTEINNNIDSIRQLALNHLHQTTYQEFTRVGGRDDFLTRFLETLQEEFESNLIVDVRFHDFVIT